MQPHLEAMKMPAIMTILRDLKDLKYNQILHLLSLLVKNVHQGPTKETQICRLYCLSQMCMHGYVVDEETIKLTLPVLVATLGSFAMHLLPGNGIETRHAVDPDWILRVVDGYYPDTRPSDFQDLDAMKKEIENVITSISERSASIADAGESTSTESPRNGVKEEGGGGFELLRVAFISIVHILCHVNKRTSSAAHRAFTLYGGYDILMCLMATESQGRFYQIPADLLLSSSTIKRPSKKDRKAYESYLQVMEALRVYRERLLTQRSNELYVLSCLADLCRSKVASTIPYVEVFKLHVRRYHTLKEGAENHQKAPVKGRRILWQHGSSLSSYLLKGLVPLPIKEGHHHHSSSLSPVSPVYHDLLLTPKGILYNLISSTVNELLTKGRKLLEDQASLEKALHLMRAIKTREDPSTDLRRRLLAARKEGHLEASIHSATIMQQRRQADAIIKSACEHHTQQLTKLLLDCGKKRGAMSEATAYEGSAPVSAPMMKVTEKPTFSERFVMPHSSTLQGTAKVEEDRSNAGVSNHFRRRKDDALIYENWCMYREDEASRASRGMEQRELAHEVEMMRIYHLKRQYQVEKQVEEADSKVAAAFRREAEALKLAVLGQQRKAQSEEKRRLRIEMEELLMASLEKVNKEKAFMEEKKKEEALKRQQDAKQREEKKRMERLSLLEHKLKALEASRDLMKEDKCQIEKRLELGHFKMNQRGELCFQEHSKIVQRNREWINKRLEHTKKQIIK